MTAMTAATLDTLSGGRFRLGLGVSGPQVSEGWHGVRFDKPLARTREYVDIVKLALAAQDVAYDGEHFTLPLPDGPGKALELTVHPVRDAHPDLPRGGRARRTSSWPARSPTAGSRSSSPPSTPAEQLAHDRARAARVGATMDGFDVVPTVPVSSATTCEACADPVRAYAALYVGGMGSREQNFYNQLAVRMGYEPRPREVQDLYLGRATTRGRGSRAVRVHRPHALLGPRERIARPARARMPTPGSPR